MTRLTWAALAAVSAVVLTRAAWSQPRPEGGRTGPATNPLTRLFDTDRDGTLSAAEIDAAAARLRTLDAAELRPAPEARRGGGPVMDRAAAPDKPPLPKDDGEKRILDALDVARHGRRYANVSTADGRLLRQLTEAVGAKTVVELGTSTGESGLWFALALRKTGGKLLTHDIDPDRIAVARENFKKAGVDDIITIVEGDAHKTAPQTKGPIDVLFIDAEKEGYSAYLKELLPLVRPGGLILAHNMRTPTPDPRYIEAITTSPDLDTSFVLMDGAGVGITLKKR